MARKLILKKEILAELSPDELASINGGAPTQILTKDLAICAAISLEPNDGCLNLTCGPGCTGRSTVVKG